jgi:hypothetical protein
MLPCEMARYIAGFWREARKYGRFWGRGPHAIDDMADRRHHWPMYFEILGEISEITTFAAGSGIREITRLRKDLWAWPLVQAKGNHACAAGGWHYPFG